MATISLHLPTSFLLWLLKFKTQTMQTQDVCYSHSTVNLKRSYCYSHMTHFSERRVIVMDLENSLTWCKNVGEWLSSCSILLNTITANQIPFVFIFNQWQLIKKCWSWIILCAQIIQQSPLSVLPLKHYEAGEADRVPTTAPRLTGFRTWLKD